MSYYPPYRSSRDNIKVELNVANNATKDDVKNITHVMLVVLRVRLI